MKQRKHLWRGLIHGRVEAKSGLITLCLVAPVFMYIALGRPLAK